MFENKKKVVNRCAVHARVYYAKDLWYGSIHKQTVIRVINKQS